jgi:ribose transport system substrate-binding protein
MAFSDRKFILCALLLTLAACNRQQKRIVGVVPQGQSHLFWQSIHAGAVAAGRETGVEILWNGPPNERDFNGQLKIVDAMINRRVDAIALSPSDRNAFVGVVERAVHEKIPVIIFDTGVDTDVFTARVATDNYGAGQLAARRMGQIMNGKGKIVEVAVAPGIASTMAREQGFEEVIHKEFPGMEIIDKRYGMADFAKSLEVAENMLTAHPDLAGLFASNESSTVGAAQALKGRAGKIKMVGFDWNPTLADGLKSGLIDSLVAQDPFRIGYDSVRAAVDKLNGGTPQKIQNLPALLVTKDNLDDPEVQKQLNPDLDKYLK